MKILPTWFYREMFNLPKGLKPEINVPAYHLHLWVLAAATLLILQYLYGSNMLTIKNVFISWPILIISDGIAHTIFGLD